MKRRLTAQEALEQEGYVVIESETPISFGAVVKNYDTTSFVPLGSECVVIGEISRSEVVEYCNRTGYPGTSFMDQGYFYKAVAE